MYIKCVHEIGFIIPEQSKYLQQWSILSENLPFLELSWKDTETPHPWSNLYICVRLHQQAIHGKPTSNRKQIKRPKQKYMYHLGYDINIIVFYKVYRTK